MRIASNTLKPDYPPHQDRELFYMGQDVQSCEQKVFLKSLRTVEILFNSVSLNNTSIVSCLQPRSLAGVKKWTITDCIPLEKLVKKPTFDEHSARLLCFTKKIQIIKEHKRKNEWNNFTTKHGLDLFCLACCAGDYYFHKQNKKTC